MSWVDGLILAIKRGESPSTRTAREAYYRLLQFNVPEVKALKLLYGSLYYAWDAWEAGREFALGKLLYEPMVRARFHQVGKRLRLTALPYVVGHVRITIGDDCYLSRFSVKTGRFVDEPELIMGNRVTLAHDVAFVVNERIELGEGVGVAANATFADSDGHPTDPVRRAAGEPMRREDIHPIVIEDHAWIGQDAHVMKGVRVGRGAIVASGSVVVTDVPENALAMGVPARIVRA